MSMWRRFMAMATGLVRPLAERVFVPMRQAGALVTEDTALTLGEWFACVNVIARTVAALPWHVFSRSALGRSQVDGSIAWLLNTQPNPEMTAFSMREAMVAHLLTWGNAYAEIQRDLSGRVVALWLLTPDRVCVERRREDNALIYRVRNEGAAESILTADQVFHVHGLGFDGLVGYSPVRLAARSIGVGIAQDTFAQSFYANGGQLGTVLEMPAGMNPQQIKDMEALYNEKHQGPDKAFKVKVAPSGMKVHPIGMPLNDAQFVESRQFTVTMAARWLGVPPHKIADLSRATNNNIEHQSIEFVTDAIVPWAIRFEQEANIKLFSPRAQGKVYTKLIVTALMRGDSKARAEYYRVMVAIGAMTINEVRALEELNGIGPTGDAHLVQLNQTTLEWLVANPGAKAAAPAPAPAPQEGDGKDGDGGDGQQRPPRSADNVIRREALEWYRVQRKEA